MNKQDKMLFLLISVAILLSMGPYSNYIKKTLNKKDLHFNKDQIEEIQKLKDKVQKKLEENRKKVSR